jgi:hypothetical protein
VGHCLIATDDGLCVGNPLNRSGKKIHFPEQLYLISKCLHILYTSI